MKKIAIIIALACCIAAPAIGLSAKDNEALPFIRIVRNPAMGAMGYAGVASSSTIAYSSFNNPAVIPFYQKTVDAAFSWQNWAPDGVKSTNLNFGTGVKLLKGRLGLAVGGAVQNGEKYDIYNSSGVKSGTFTPKDMVLNFGASTLIFKDFAAGVNVRYAKQDLSDDVNYDTFAMDMFLAYRLEKIDLTAGISSLGSAVTSDDGNDFSIPTSATIGGSYHEIFKEVHGIEANLDMDYFFSGNFTFALGAQYSWKETIFLRAGYHFGADDAVLPSFVTFGLGAQLKGFRLDFCYLTGNEAIKNTLSVGLGFSF